MNNIPPPSTYGFADALLDPIGAKQKGWPHAAAISLAVGILTAGAAHLVAAVTRGFFYRKEPAANETHAKMAEILGRLFGIAVPKRSHRAEQLLSEFGLRLNADGKLDPGRTDNRAALDSLQSLISDNIPVKIRDWLEVGQLERSQPDRLERQLKCLATYSLLAIEARLPPEHLSREDWLDRFTKAAASPERSCPEELHVQLAGAPSLVPVCIPAGSLAKARHLHLCGDDTRILHALPPTIESITIVGGGPSLLEKLAELEPVTLEQENKATLARGEKPGPKLNRIILQGCTPPGDQVRKSVDLRKRYPNLKIVTTDNVQGVNACLKPGKVAVSEKTMLEYFLRGTSDHTWKAYALEGKLRMKVGTFDLLGKCDNACLRGANPTYIHETLGEYKARKRRQFGEILSLLSEGPPVQDSTQQRTPLDVLALQGTDFLHYAQLKDSDKDPAELRERNQVCGELRDDLLRELNKLGFALITSAPLGPPSGQAPVALIYREKKFELKVAVDSSDKKTLVPCFRHYNQQVDAVAFPGGLAILEDTDTQEEVSIATAQLAFQGATEEDLKNHQNGMGRPTIVLGVFNHSFGQKGGARLLANPTFRTHAAIANPNELEKIPALSASGSDACEGTVVGGAFFAGDGVELKVHGTEME